MDILQLENATVYRGPAKVFEDICLSIELGVSTAIVGPNGAGKSTLLKLLARELYPSAGSVKIFGRDRWNVWELRKRLGLVSPDLQHNYAPAAIGKDVVLSGFHSSVNVHDHQQFEGSQLAFADKVIQELGIEHLRGKSFSRMSTGEQRRHLLARALVNDPEALILDEPTSGLDLQASFQYLETARQLMSAGKTLVLVTHHIHEIPPEISQVVLLKAGMVVGQGSKSEMLTNERLSSLFDIPLEVVSANGYFQVLPA